MGGGIYTLGSTNLTVLYTTIQNNYANITGGGLFCLSSGILTFSEYYFNDNQNLSTISNIECSSPCNSALCNSFCTPSCQNFCPIGLWGSKCLPCNCNTNGGLCNNNISATQPCTCYSGFAGINCNLVCPNCNIGYCNETANGNGDCICPLGFDSKLNCTDCLQNYYTTDCILCNCYNHGTCTGDGINGNGSCTCNAGYDPNYFCEFPLINEPNTNNWLIPVLVTAGVIIVILLIIVTLIYKKMRDVHEEVVIGQNVHTGVEFDSTSKQTYTGDTTTMDNFIKDS